MSHIYYHILPLFFIALIGSIIRRIWIKSDEFWRGLEKLSNYVLFPAMLFIHTSRVDLHNSKLVDLAITLIVTNLVTAWILMIFKIQQNYNDIQFTSILQGSIRYNNYIFFAVGSAIFGKHGMQIIATISPCLLILTNITAIISFIYYIPTKNTRKLTKIKGILFIIKSIVNNPFVVSSLAGILFNYLNITLNSGVQQTLDYLSNTALVIGMLIVGAGLKCTIQQKHFKQTLFTSSIKLILMPIITLIVLWFMNVNGIHKSIGMLFSSLPCASSSYILSKRLGGDTETMSSIITLTTIFSILSLSLTIYIING